jgi:hypothetical protein
MGSTYLFAHPSALAGVGRIFDFAGSFDAYNVSPTPEIADSLATFLDWRAVGSDIMDAVAAHEQAEQPAEQQLQLALDEK